MSAPKAIPTDPLFEDEEYLKFGVKPTNALLIRPAVGKVKRSTFNVPEDTVFGRVLERDDEDAGAVVQSWQQHVPNPAAAPGRDFVRMNKTATKLGCTSAREVAQFRQEHDIRLQTGRTHKTVESPPPPEEGFGKLRRGPQEDIKAVMSNQYQREWVKNQRDLHSTTTAKQAVNKKLFGKPAPTAASLGHTVKPPEPEKERFVMKKFENVPSKIKAMGLIGADEPKDATVSAEPAENRVDLDQ